MSEDTTFVKSGQSTQKYIQFDFMNCVKIKIRDGCSDILCCKTLHPDSYKGLLTPLKAHSCSALISLHWAALDLFQNNNLDHVTYLQTPNQWLAVVFRLKLRFPMGCSDLHGDLTLQTCMMMTVDRQIVLFEYPWCTLHTFSHWFVSTALLAVSLALLPLNLHTHSAPFYSKYPENPFLIWT